MKIHDSALFVHSRDFHRFQVALELMPLAEEWSEDFGSRLQFSRGQEFPHSLGDLSMQKLRCLLSIFRRRSARNNSRLSIIEPDIAPLNLQHFAKAQPCCRRNQIRNATFPSAIDKLGKVIVG